jgi:glutathione synthase/RimK-type ligase-like ATP-grasp enzyme
MSKIDIVLLTEKKYVNPLSTDWYIDQVLMEDKLVQDALMELGYKVKKVDWADADFDWSEPKIAVFRTIWDYFHRFGEFKTWLEKTKSLTHFVNPYEQVIWNVDKHYLQDLEKKGVPIVETVFIEVGEKQSLTELVKEQGWQKAVLKPCVSGGGRHTYLLNQTNISEHEQIFAELIKNEAMMLQPFVESITLKGEVSHVVIGGKHMHSVLKLAKTGDYRVQDDFGGTVHEYKASAEEITFAENTAKACEPLPAYARIDVVWGSNDELLIGEVELIEPELWFRKNPAAAKELAKVIAANFKALA